VLAACAPAAPTQGAGGAADNSAQPQPSYSPLTFQAADRAAARQQALAAMRAYARPHRSPKTWWAGLAPHLSAAAQSDYTGTDPSQILAARITGPATLTPASLPALARVAVPTDAGIYLVLLARSPGQGWTVERITPPEPVHQ